MATVNEEYLDALIRHQVFLLRSSGSIRNKITSLLNETEKDIAEKIRYALRDAKGLSPSSLRRAKTLQKEINVIRGNVWDKVDEVWLQELNDLVTQEAVILQGITQTVSPVVLELTLPATNLLQSLVETSAFEGRTLKEWSSSIRATDLRRIEDQIKIGMVQGESSDDIARRVVGTAKLKGRDGVTQITRRNAEAITRTAVNRLSNAARSEFNKLNQSFIEGELYVSTLDSRTTAICRSLDGEIFPVGEGHIPPLHFNCRSLRVAVMDGKIVGERPAKPTTERMLLKEYAKKHKIGDITNRNALPRGHKGSYDKYAQQRIRDLTGQVPAKTTYNEWLKRQSTDFQDDVLGTTKSKLFRKGELSLDKFVNRSGDELSLRDLASKHENAFRKAGLDPEDYLK